MPKFTTPFWDKSGRLYRPGTEVPESALGATPAAPEADAEDPNWPKNFPGAADLKRAGVESAAAAQGMSKDELLAVDGIGPKTADAILAHGQ